MKIRKLHIKNYKVFDDIEFDFTDRDGKTLDTVVLAGVNGCGKTTVLEVIKDILSLNFFGIRPYDFDIHIKFEIEEADYKRASIHGKNYPGPILSANFGQNQTGVDYLRGFSMNQFGLVPAIYLPVKEVFKLDDSHVLVLGLNVHKDLMKENLLKSIRDEIFKNLNQPPKNLIELEIKKVNSSLNGLGLNTNLIDFKSDELVFQSANGRRIYFEQLSHGEQNLYFRAIYLSQLHLENGILLIDEPEAALHPAWQQKIAQLYQQIGTNNQVFMATHSPHIMASVPPECLFVLNVEEGEGGKKKIRAINMGTAGKHTLGVEPNRILQEVMQVKTLRDYETQWEIDRLSELLNFENFDSREAENLVEKLTNQLGRQDPFIMRTEHQLLVLRRKKATLEPVAVA